MIVANRIKALREEQGWSQEELGNRVDVSRQAINMIERGKHNSSLRLAFRFSRVFGAPIETIFDTPKE